MARLVCLSLIVTAAACSSGDSLDAGSLGNPDGNVVSAMDARVDLSPDAAVRDANDADAHAPDATPPDAQAPDATPPDADAPPDPCSPNPCFDSGACSPADAGFACAPCPTGYEGDGVSCTDVDGCVGATCFPSVACIDVPAPGVGFVCGACPPGLEGDGTSCTEIDGCAGGPCLAGTTCTDIPAPSDGFSCTVCMGATCPTLRAQAGPDQEIVSSSTATLAGTAVGYNGSYGCAWSNDQDARTWATCTPTVSPAQATIYTLTVTDASGLSASDSVVVRIADLIAYAGPDTNIIGTESATLSATWAGASCTDGSCVSCEWRLSTGMVVSSSCDTVVAPTATTQYFLTVSDDIAQRTARDSVTVFVTDQPAQLCGWDVVVMTSDEYPTGANPNYVCDSTGTARRQTVNGKPAIVLSDLVVENVRITGHISVEVSSDDDLIGFLWGWQNPKHAYLLTWKQLSQSWTARCGNAPAGIAIKKIDGAVAAPDTISFNPSFGFNATDYVYSCAVGWSQDRSNAALLNDSTIFLAAPGDTNGFRGSWADLTTYRFEFYYTPTRTRILVYADDLMSGSTDALLASFLVEDSSYPAGAFAFFSNSQEQVAFGDFVLASLSDYRADAGPDQAISSGASVDLVGSAILAVPPYLCEWSDGTMSLAGTDCTITVSPTTSTNYLLMVTDDFGRVASSTVTVSVAP